MQHRLERRTDEGHDVGIDALLENEHLLLGAENLLLVLLELLGDVTLGIGQRLFAYPRRGDLVPVGVTDLDVVAEDVVVADLERRDARCLALALLDARKVVLAVERDAAQVVQFGIYAVGDDPSLLNLVVLRIGIDFAGDAFADPGQRVDARSQRMQPVVVRGFERGLERLDRRERIFELHQFARRDALRGDTRRDTFQIAHHRHLLAHGVRQVGLLREALHDVEPLVDLRRVLDRHGDPPLQQTAAHRRQRAVDDVGEAALLACAVRGEELQVADRELIDPHVIVLVDARERGDVSRLAVLGELEVVENGPGGRNAAREVVHAETFQRLGPELPAKFPAIDLLREDPLVETVGVEPRPESVGETVLVAALVDHLFGLKIGDELVRVAVRALGHVELPGRDVEKRHARRPTAEIDRGDIVVLLVGQNVVTQNDARRHQFDDTALDQSLDQLGVFELLADRHALASPDEFRQVGVDGMVGKSRQLHVGRRTVRTARERDAQNAAGLDRVVAERFVKVAHTEEQNGVGMHGLDGVILLHQGRFDVFFFNFLLRNHNKILYELSNKDNGFSAVVQKAEAKFFGPGLRRPLRKRIRKRESDRPIRTGRDSRKSRNGRKHRQAFPARERLPETDGSADQIMPFSAKTRR